MTTRTLNNLIRHRDTPTQKGPSIAAVTSKTRRPAGHAYERPPFENGASTFLPAERQLLVSVTQAMNVRNAGDCRALIVLQRLILPDGSSLRIDNAPAIDAACYAELEDRVDFHTWSLLRGIGLATLLGVGTELSIDGESDLVRAIREATQQNAARAGDQIVQRDLNIQPTITIRPGAPVRLVVHKDLVFAPLGRGGL